MRRPWLQFSGIASMVMLATAAGLSYVWSFGYAQSGKRFECFIVQGDLQVNVFPPGYWANVRGAGAVPWRSGVSVSRAPLFPPLVSLPGVVSDGSGRWNVCLPLYVPLLALAAALVYPRLSFVRGRRLRKRGLCTQCGYDLTANVAGRCPECGLAIEQTRIPPNQVDSEEGKGSAADGR